MEEIRLRSLESSVYQLAQCGGAPGPPPQPTPPTVLVLVLLHLYHRLKTDLTAVPDWFAEVGETKSFRSHRLHRG